MKKLAFLTIIFTFSIGFAYAEEKQCEQNFKAEGSFFSGKMYQSFATVKGNKDVVFNKIGAKLGKEGLKIENSNREFGTINGSYKSGVVTATITPTEKEGLLQIDIQASLKTGVLASDDNYKKQICDILESAN